mgnify:FL=1
MPESAAEPTPTPYISPKDDEANAGRLKPDVAHQVYNDIRQEADRWSLKINPDDSPIKKRLKHFALSKVFGLFSRFTLLDYQAAQIVDAEEKAGRDPLTGLLNRRAFEDRVKQRLSEGTAGLAIMIDADHFKQVNDTYGHDIGDQVLQRIALGLQENVQLSRDIICRWGGEEFAVFILISSLDIDKAKIFEIAERVRKNVVKYLGNIRYEISSNGKSQENLIPITVSLGATITHGEHWEQAIKRADEHLYQAKNGGRDQSIGDNGKISFTPTPPPDVRPETASS